MTRRRWIADEFSADRAALRGAHAAHLARTLRARVGQEFEIACGDQVRRATIASVASDRVEFALGEEIPANSVVPVTLVLAIFKFDRMEWAIEKCTELDVTTIVPIIARRTEKHLAAAAQKRTERWRRITREATQQARRATPPEIADPVKLADLLALRAAATGEPNSGAANTPQSASRIVLSESEHEVSLIDVLRSRPAVPALTLAVGPEGGWTPEELQAFTNAQWTAAALGSTILRAETAAIAALAIARAEIAYAAAGT